MARLSKAEAAAAKAEVAEAKQAAEAEAERKVVEAKAVADQKKGSSVEPLSVSPPPPTHLPPAKQGLSHSCLPQFVLEHQATREQKAVAGPQSHSIA